MDWAFWRKPPPPPATTVAAPIVSAPDPIPAPEGEVTGATLWGCGHQSESGAWSPVSETSCCLACHQDRIS